MGSARAKVASGLFCANGWPFWPSFWDMDFKLVLPSIYINFDIQTKFEVNQTQIGYFIPKQLQKLTKVAISQNPILPKCHSPKSLLLLHFSMNLSETFRIDVNMDFAHTNHGRFFLFRPPKKFEPSWRKVRHRPIYEILPHLIVASAPLMYIWQMLTYFGGGA